MENYSFENQNLKTRSRLEEMKPIYGCLINEDEIDPVSKKNLSKIKKEGVNIDFDAFSSDSREKGMLSPKQYSYLISGIDKESKYSQGYYNCTGVVFVGKDKNSGEEISFMSHQNPLHFLGELENQFTLDLGERIKEFKSKCSQKTIDAIVFGGKYEYLNDFQYKDSIKLLSSISKKELGFEPVVLTGPNLESGETDAYFDTEHRRFYLVRRKQSGGVSNNNFSPSKIHAESEKWDEFAG